MKRSIKYELKLYGSPPIVKKIVHQMIQEIKSFKRLVDDKVRTIKGNPLEYIDNPILLTKT